MGLGPAAARATDRKGMHVLLVALEPAFAARLAIAFASAGHTAAALSADEAVCTVSAPRTEPAAAALVHGAGAHGALETCARLRRASNALAITALVDDAPAAEIAALADAGVDDFVLSSDAVEVAVARLVFARARREMRAPGMDESEPRAELAAKLRLADRMSSIGTLAAGVAHELNHPLAFVMGNIDIALRELTELERVVLPVEPAPASARVASRPPFPYDDGTAADRIASVLAALRAAHKGSAQMREIVRSLRTFSHPNDGEREAVDVRGAVRSALQLAAGTLRPRARVVERYDDELLVWANEAQLVQVFLNLVVNAAQATQEGAVEPTIYVTATADGERERVMVEVRDEGIGMSPDQKARIFEPFFTTKKRGEGTGLGLSICLGIVTSLGGEITVESEPGRGATFRVLLPAHRPQTRTSAPDPGEARADEPPGSRRRVLVVDDEPMIGTMIEQLFGEEVEVSKEEQAARALSRIRGGERFDVILCDLMMPSMSGSDLHAELVKLAPDQAERMVFITGGAFTASARQFLGRVANARIDKPFDLERLSALLKGVPSARAVV